MKFPRHVFKNGGKHQRAGGSYSSELAQDDAEHAALLADGWFATLPEAIAAAAQPVAAAESKGEPTRAEKEQKLTELGVNFDRRLGDKKLAALLEDALSKKP